MLKVQVKVLPHGAGLPLPKYMSEHSAGMDLCAAVEKELIIAPGAWTLVPTGLAIALPEGYEAQVRPRSGLALKQGVSVLNTPGTVDADYRGEVGVILMNHSKQELVIKRGDRIAQMIINKYERIAFEEVTELSATDRGAGGFGSTGKL
ncbi:deoxyuridine 5'-triphosphate nucleotidohydrolase [candidate division WOR-1 bacterium RIFOXYA12_FULL_52_29]|uniref:Deoxyuridine 5'-triphosphate nucleotidohydrolase n=1 Tax=candidate division WOR-1 bacterium RIFOXYC12_FULL_54_18 TaxID=1802584 RepID=A0A1F4T6D8_UNCSA|nr:MAG: deoxyuridine 5'-triphosphate nucleotidohydrolase [candidate division WOR-1 bacterium RIFOXYA2_FULL_51_19]OGC17857.1 MAG: deoxyuridine 5'-triphosphate nucleotidohydrolase [candidate division WOR-1 bacterium RIFOXYA12_FULL_52_29]OGC26714.1 MAG: deoxyuridine 5'-triphosphate nucleotidohydrolase [candidate division WOR-1 bacterium RIFOXYB2_FULL_45_9]OGC28274.1 MAG: deoxyuridine 5'-triphosphate nucleotidohydrolase [candidate division WOR-1 bacterium RIFOXYC12_FULL_54_18]OGC31268.1 MAG: deoxyu